MKRLALHDPGERATDVWSELGLERYQVPCDRNRFTFIKVLWVAVLVISLACEVLAITKIGLVIPETSREGLMKDLSVPVAWDADYQ